MATEQREGSDVAEDIKGTLRFIENSRKRLREIDDKKQAAIPGDRAKLGYLKTHFSKLRYKAVTLQAILAILECLENSELLDVNKEDAEFKSTSRTVNDLKDDLEEAQKVLEEHAEKIEELYNALSVKYQQIEDQIETIQAKKVKYQSRFEQCQEVANIVGDQVLQQNDGNLLHKNAAALKSLSASLAEADKEMNLMQVQSTDLTNTLRKLQAELKELKAELDTKKAQSVQSTSVMARIQWCKDILDLMSKLSGVREKGICGSMLTLEFVPPEGSSNQTPLELQLSYVRNKCGTYVLDAASVNVDTLDVKQFVKEAVQTNNTRILVTQIWKAWTGHWPLLHEVELLRQRYAVDWIDKEGILRGLFGDGGRTIATLSLPQGYPAKGSVTLTKVERLPDGVTVESLKPKQEKPSLTDWMEYLHETLH